MSWSNRSSLFWLLAKGLAPASMQGNIEEWEADLIDLISYECAVTGRIRSPTTAARSTAADCKRCPGKLSCDEGAVYMCTHCMHVCIYIYA